MDIIINLSIDTKAIGCLVANMILDFLKDNRLEEREMISKIQNHHREKSAYIYLRQSTMGQVRHHQESTERQYA